jgi:hypothetical protein
MVEINLLPWREYAAARTRTKFKIILGAALIFLAVIVSAVIFLCRRDPPVRLATPLLAVSDTRIEQLKKIKYVGYLHHQQRMWALISMPDGKILDARAGSVIRGTCRIISLNETELVLAPTSNSFSKIKILLSHS